MKNTECLKLASIEKNKSFYEGNVIMMFDVIKCMQGDYVSFRQKSVPKELLKYVGKDLSKRKSNVYVNCKLLKIETETSTVIDGGEEYEVSTGVSKDSKVKIISFDSVRYS